MSYEVYDHFFRSLDMIEDALKWKKIYVADFLIGKETLDFTVINNA